MHNGQSRQRNRYFKIADRKEKKKKKKRRDRKEKRKENTQWNILEDDH
jgi:hypothetical protein